MRWAGKGRGCPQDNCNDFINDFSLAPGAIGCEGGGGVEGDRSEWVQP